MTYDPYSPYGSPPPGWPPQPYPPAATNRMATWSIVFAFLCAPVGAALGHLALDDIRHTAQPGRGRAVTGLVLSYTFIVVAVGALLVWTILPTRPVNATAAPTKTTLTAPPMPTATATPTSPTPTSTTPKPPAVSTAELPRVLLNLDELKAVVNIPGLTPIELPQVPGGSGGAPAGDPVSPPECASAILAGIDTTYDGTGVLGLQAPHFRDSATATLIQEVAAAFPSAAEAQEFVAQQTDVWRKCSGKTLTVSAPPGEKSSTWAIGNVVVTEDRVTLQNTVNARKQAQQVRIMATKANVVVDLNTFSKEVSLDEAETVATQILARIPG